MSELSELDGLMESDIMDALGQKNSEETNTTDTFDENEIRIEDFNEDFNEDFDLDNALEEMQKDSQTQEQSISDTKFTTETSTHDLASLLTQLLQNKTIEITIKIKD